VDDVLLLLEYWQHEIPVEGFNLKKENSVTTFVDRSWHFALFTGCNRDGQFRRKDLAAHENILLTGLNVIYTCILRHIYFNYSY
jgi:hypothetical protein